MRRLGITSTKEEQAKLKLPQALGIQRKKILIATNKTPFETAQKISEEDEQLVKNVATNLVPARAVVSRETKPSDDSVLHMIVNATLTELASFDVSTYLDHASIVCARFSVKRVQCSEFEHKSLRYVLTHSRQFGDATKPIFKSSALSAVAEGNDNGVNSNQQTVPQMPPASSILERAQKLIIELQQEYDDAKFKALNAQITTFALIIVRREVKKIVQRDRYFALHPDLWRKVSILLVIEAYLTTDDEKTKKNLHDTCVKFIEWHDMYLPYLFDKVLDLYNIEAGELWDHLSSIQCPKMAISLINFASVCYNRYEQSKAITPEIQRWFPYSRFFDSHCYKTLADKENVSICAILNILVEMKDNKDIRAANKYTMPADTQWAQRVATDLFKKINK